MYKIYHFLIKLCDVRTSRLENFIRVMNERLSIRIPANVEWVILILVPKVLRGKLQFLSVTTYSHSLA